MTNVTAHEMGCGWAVDPPPPPSEGSAGLSTRRKLKSDDDHQDARRHERVYLFVDPLVVDEARRFHSSLAELRISGIDLDSSESAIKLYVPSLRAVFIAKDEQNTVVSNSKESLIPHQVVPLRERILSPITTLLRHARIFGTASALFNSPTTPSGYTCVRAHQIKSGFE